MWVSDMQRGFLGGRSILANVLDVDFESMRISLKAKQSAMVLFDFAAAFPSKSHTYLSALRDSAIVLFFCLGFESL